MHQDKEKKEVMDTEAMRKMQEILDRLVEGTPSLQDCIA